MALVLCDQSMPHDCAHSNDDRLKGKLAPELAERVARFAKRDEHDGGLVTDDLQLLEKHGQERGGDPANPAPAPPAE